MPVHYFDEASSISFGRAGRYAMETLLSLGSWYSHRLGLQRSALFEPRSPDPRPADPAR